jgi:acetyl-CoA carboxylase beta subunit
METAELLEAVSELCILDESGDSRMQWDRNNPQQVAEAKARFNELKAKHYLAYKVDPASGGQGEVIHDFDPKAERIILHQQNVGG